MPGPMVDTTSKTSKITVTPMPVKDPSALPANFGPEQMLAWLYSQMRQSNHDVQVTLREVEASRARLTQLGALQQNLRDLKAKAGVSGGESKATTDGTIDWESYRTSDLKTGDSVVDEAKLAKEEWYQALGPEGKAAVKKFVMQCNPEDHLVMEKQIDALLDKVKDEISGINSNNEIQMINLQHVMQQRNQAIQLASNIISVVDREADTPIGNIGKIG